MNECKSSGSSGSICGEHSFCTDTIGSYVCKCHQGYFEDSNGNCVSKLTTVNIAVNIT